MEVIGDMAAPVGPGTGATGDGHLDMARSGRRATGTMPVLADGAGGGATGDKVTRGDAGLQTLHERAVHQVPHPIRFPGNPPVVGS